MGKCEHDSVRWEWEGLGQAREVLSEFWTTCQDCGERVRVRKAGLA